MKVRKLLFVLFLFSIVLPSFSTISVHFNNTKALLPKVLEGSAYTQYNNKIYSFGGFTFDLEQQSCYSYDPVTDTIFALANLQQGRFYATASELNGKIYVIGGAKTQGGGSYSLDSVEIYDVASNSFSNGVSLPVPLRGASSVSANGKIYVIGGRTNSGFSNQVYAFDPTSNTWSAVSTAPFAVAYGGAFYLASENSIYFFGGLLGEPTSSANFFGKCYSYDIAGNSWSFVANMQIKTANFAVAYDQASSKVYIVGGTWYDSSANNEIPFYDIQIFDASLKNFSSGTLPILPSPWSRFNNCAGFISNKLYLLAGANVVCVDLYDTSTGTFYEPNKRMGEDISGGASFVYDNKFYIVDGGFFSPLTGKVLVYDPSSNYWTTKNGVDPQARIYPAFGSYDDKLVISSGMNTSGAVLNTAYFYDPSSDSFSQISGALDPNPSLAPASAVYNGKLYIFGGRTTYSNPNSLSKKTRILDLISGTFSTGSDLPFELESASAVAVNDKIYIFGGSTLTAPDYINKNVLIFDPSSQTFTTSTQIPYPTYGSSATVIGNYVIVDSGYYLFYSSAISGLAGGPLPFIQVFDTTSNTFTIFERPIGRRNHSSGIIGTKYYSTAGDDYYWPEERLDVADITISGCYFSCTASSDVTSGGAPLTVNFTSSVSGSGCSGTPSYNWNFGDGNSSTDQNPSHTYTTEGSYNWSLTINWDGQSCQKSGTVTVGGCIITCDTTVSPTSGTAPLAVNFSASSTSTGCTSAVSYEWDFGDGQTSTQQTTTHTYQSEGTYNYTLKAKADSTECTKNGTITVSSTPTCTLTCDAVANPINGTAPLLVNFTGSETHTNCSGTPQFLWNFGDGETSTSQSPTHTYQNPGSYNWSFSVTVDGKNCSKTGTVTVSSPTNQPVITSVSKMASPFRLRVIGGNFVDGSNVLINDVQVPSTKFKSSNYLIAKKGADLKALVPKGVTVKIKVKNPDGTLSNEYPYTR